ncbi:MAG: rhodanese-like domain-containing protein [Bacilli bacterium]|nr:rhodanese-like domain-containing protein [Bacilli bacterium]
MIINIQNLLNINNPIIIDIRNNYYYNMGHIKNAISIPYYNLLNNYSHYLNKDNTYYLYCDTGDQSYDIAERLQKFGYKTISIDGGYIAYCRLKGELHKT